MLHHLIVRFVYIISGKSQFLVVCLTQASRSHIILNSALRCIDTGVFVMLVISISNVSVSRLFNSGFVYVHALTRATLLSRISVIAVLFSMFDAWFPMQTCNTQRVMSEAFSRALDSFIPRQDTLSRFAAICFALSYVLLSMKFPIFTFHPFSHVWCAV